ECLVLGRIRAQCVDRDARTLVTDAHRPARAREVAVVPLAVGRDLALRFLVQADLRLLLLLLLLLLLRVRGVDRAGGTGGLRLPDLVERAVHARQRDVVPARLVREVHGRHRVVADVLREVEREHAEEHEDPENEDQRDAALAGAGARHQSSSSGSPARRMCGTPGARGVGASSSSSSSSRSSSSLFRLSASSSEPPSTTASFIATRLTGISCPQRPVSTPGSPSMTTRTASGRPSWSRSSVQGFQYCVSPPLTSM